MNFRYAYRSSLTTFNGNAETLGFYTAKVKGLNPLPPTIFSITALWKLQNWPFSVHWRAASVSESPVSQDLDVKSSLISVGPSSVASSLCGGPSRCRMRPAEVRFGSSGVIGGTSRGGAPRDA